MHFMIRSLALKQFMVRSLLQLISCPDHWPHYIWWSDHWQGISRLNVCLKTIHDHFIQIVWLKAFHAQIILLKAIHGQIFYKAFHDEIICLKTFKAQIVYKAFQGHIIYLNTFQGHDHLPQSISRSDNLTQGISRSFHLPLSSKAF